MGKHSPKGEREGTDQSEEADVPDGANDGPVDQSEE